MRPSRSLTLIPLLAGVLCACASSSRKAEREVADLVQHGRYVEALHRAEKRAADAPGDPAAAEALRLARTALLLEQGRRATFEDDDELALEAFELAAEVSPGDWVVGSWVDKTRGKLCEHWLDVAQAYSADGELDAALAAFERANQYSPGDRTAEEGISYVLLRINYREGRGSEYYREGLAALRDYWLNYAQQKMEAADIYLEDDAAVARRLAEIRTQKAEERLAVARDLEGKGLFFAARNEYRIAQILDPENAEAQAGRRRMQDEASADDMLRQADIAVRKGDLEAAEHALAQARSLTELQGERVDLVVEEVRRARFQGLYDRAYELEDDGRFEEAIVAYAELVDVAGYYGDAIARRETLVDLVADAERLWAAHEAAADETEALSFLRQIAQFWPDYRDVSARLAAAGETIGGWPAGDEVEPADETPEPVPEDPPVAEDPR